MPSKRQSKRVTFSRRTSNRRIPRLVLRNKPYFILY